MNSGSKSREFHFTVSHDVLIMAGDSVDIDDKYIGTRYEAGLCRAFSFTLFSPEPSFVKPYFVSRNLSFPGGHVPFHLNRS